MAIKPEADRYFSNKDDERDLARRLDEAFDITFRSAYGDLSFWLAEPKTQTKERFGLRQEVLTIYSPHAKTDARVLTTIENITRSPDFKHRVEKVLFLLIHKGDEEETNELMSTSTDRIVVPIRVEELLTPQRGSLFLRNKIAQSISSIDLFGMSSAITSEKYFFGRNELVQAITSIIVVNHQNSGLFGLRKTGKTSVLEAIKRRIEDRPILTEYVECSNPGIHSARWWQVLENLIDRCAQTLKRQFNRNVQVRGDYNQANAGTRFSSDIKALLELGRLDQIILMLDEVEFI